jgi:hypothetical protein
VPSFRRLSREELQALPTRKARVGPIDLTEYLNFVRELGPGEGGEIALGDGDSQRTIKRRLTRAAGQLKKRIRWRNSRGDGVIRFVVQESLRRPT